MRKTILAAVCATAIGALSIGAASAQTSGPAGQDSTKMGTDTNMSKDTMGKTQGMSKTTSKTHKSMKKDKLMKSDGMSK